MYRHLDLFSGIGGFALAARRVGFQTVGFVEIDEWCRQVLAKNFPGVPIHDDIETYTAAAGSADIITAGWPCQDISLAGKGAGLDGARSGLFFELARIIGDVRPRLVVMENVSALLVRGFDAVLGRLAEIGYDCEWHCIPASSVGAPHRRDRIWIVAYPNSLGLRHEHFDAAEQTQPSESADDGQAELVADADGIGRPLIGVAQYESLQSERGHQPDGCSATGSGGRPNGSDAGCQYLEGWQPQAAINRPELWRHAGWWATEPDVGRVADGVPRRVDRLRGLGNAIVPQIAESIFTSLLRTTP